MPKNSREIDETPAHREWPEGVPTLESEEQPSREELPRERSGFLHALRRALQIILMQRSARP
jgi:hypothetical protein